MREDLDGSFEHLARRFLDDERWRAHSSRDAERLFAECASLFRDVAEVRLDQFGEGEDAFDIDDALFAASFDLGMAAFRHAVRKATVIRALESIRGLFEGHYVHEVESISCRQFWDNVLGYRDIDDSTPKSLLWLLDGSLSLLRLLAVHPERHMRASALHGLNHFPALESARLALTEVASTELDEELKTYAEQALDAFARGKRLI